MLLTVSAKIKVPFYPVLMTMQTFVVVLIENFRLEIGIDYNFSLSIWGCNRSSMVGTPEKVGISYITGPTGGYLIGFITSVLIAGFVNFRNIFVSSYLSHYLYLHLFDGVPWLAYLAGWEVAYVWGIKNFVLAEILKLQYLLYSEKLLKIGNLFRRSFDKIFAAFYAFKSSCCFRYISVTKLKTLWICSHFHSICWHWFSGGDAFLFGSANNAFSTSSHQLALLIAIAPSLTAATAVGILP